MSKRSIFGVLICFLLLGLFSVFMAKQWLDAQTQPNIQIEPPIDPLALNEVDRLLKKFDFGSIAFNVPSSMKLSELKEINLLLSHSKSVQSLVDTINIEGKKYGSEIKLSNRMQATLKGSGFEVTELSPRIQAVSSDVTSKWKWEVKAKEAGVLNLHFNLSALITLDGASTPIVVDTFNKKVEVKVTKVEAMKHFIISNWQWIVATLIIPLTGYLWRVRSS
ncbi:hypothetical protein C4G67_RS06115 [Vibrio parahaemolyticus]|nr:hypothetical protein [Vibrio parahaemolyticus]